MPSVINVSSDLEQMRPTPRSVSPQTSPNVSAAMIMVDDQLVVADPDNSAVMVLETAQLDVVDTLAVPGWPESVLALPDRQVIAAQREGESLAWLDLEDSGTAPKTLALGGRPHSMALTPDGTTMYVSLPDLAQVAKVDLSSWRIVARLDTLLEPTAVAVTPDGALLIAHRQDDLLMVAPDGTAHSAPMRTTNPWQTTGDAALRRATGASGIAIDPRTGDALVLHCIATPRTNEMAPLPAYYEVASRTTGMTTTLSRVRVEDGVLVPPEVGEDMPLDVPVITQPTHVAHHPTATLAFITGRGTNQVWVVNTAFNDPMLHPVGVISVGSAPSAAVVSKDGSLLYVLNAHSYSVSEVELSPDWKVGKSSGALGEPFAAPPAEQPFQYLTTSRARQFAQNPLSEEMSLGRTLFTSSIDRKVSRSGFACATCHTDGAEDHLVWDFPGGRRQTPALGDRLRGAGPFNWEGTEMFLVGNFGRTISRMGGSGLSCDELMALERFVLDGGPREPRNPHRSADGLTPAQERGKALFVDKTVGCSSCHSGDVLTDGQEHKGMIPNGKTALNTPSLRGLWRTAPYLHDGSAPDLFAVLKITRGSMGDTTALTDEDKSDLVAYLLTL